MSRFTVIRDTREQQGWHFPETDICNGTVPACLPAGDYSIEGLEDVFCIERKMSTGEIAGNMGEKRFIPLLERMSQYKHKFFVVEFSYQDVLRFPINSGIPKYRWEKLRVTSNWMQKYIADIQVKYDIHFIFANNKETAEYAAFNIMKNINYLYASDKR